jgi:hypothetical protein
VQDGAGPVEFQHHQARLQPKAKTGALHYRATGRRVTAHEQRDADDPFAPDDRDLGRRSST